MRFPLLATIDDDALRFRDSVGFYHGMRADGDVSRSRHARKRRRGGAEE